MSAWTLKVTVEKEGNTLKMKPYSFLVPLPDATAMLTGMLTQMEPEIEGLPSKNKLQLTLIDDGCAQRLFTSLRGWIAERNLSEKIYLHRAKGEACTLKVQFAEEEGRSLTGSAHPKISIAYLYLILGILVLFI